LTLICFLSTEAVNAVCAASEIVTTEGTAPVDAFIVRDDGDVMVTSVPVSEILLSPIVVAAVN
jgi:hypothetical protein